MSTHLKRSNMNMIKNISVKTYLIIALLVLSNIALYAGGTISSIYSQPAAFTPDEEVTFFFDVSGTDLDGNTGPLYLWTWSPGDPVNGNGDWDNSADQAVLTQIDGNLWSFTMIPADFYGTSEITKIEGLLKTDDGSLQTDNFDEASGNPIWLFDFSTSESKLIIAEPSLFKIDKPLSIIINVSNACGDGCSNRGELVGKRPSIHSGINGWSNVVDSGEAKTLLTEVAGYSNVWKLDIIPMDYWGVEASTTLSEINCLFNDNGSWDFSARDEGGENFLLMPVDPNAEVILEFTFFPQKFSNEDVVSITFNQEVTANEGLKTASEIYYTIDINDGEANFDGKSKLNSSGLWEANFIPFRIFPDLSITKMTVYFKNADGSEVSEPLVLDNIIDLN